MKSARLSSSAPNGVVAFKRRARRPSSPSNTPAAMIANTAYWNWPPIAKRIAVMPAHSASSVRTLGTMRLTDSGDSRRTRMRGRRIRTRDERIAKVLLLIAFDASLSDAPVYINSASARRASMRDAVARRLGRQPVGDDGLAGDHALAEGDQRHIGRRTIDVDPRAEANEADALAGGQTLALVERADDAPRHQTGDQHAGDLRAVLGRREAQRQTLVVEARLVEAGVEETSLGVAPRRHPAGDRRARDMHVEQVEEDA